MNLILEYRNPNEYLPLSYDNLTKDMFLLEKFIAIREFVQLQGK